MAGCNGFARLSASPLLGRQGSDFGRRGWRHLGRGGDLRKPWFEAGPVGVGHRDGDFYWLALLEAGGAWSVSAVG